jgi:hypothetical protein
MPKIDDRVFKKGGLFLWMLALAGLLVSGGCHSQKTPASYDMHTAMPINKVVVDGFHAAMPQGMQPDVVRDPLSGTAFMAEPVPQNVANRMTDILYNRVAAEKGYGLVSPDQAKLVFSSIIRSNENVAISPIEVLQEVGNTFKADAVLTGYIYRWREREGTDYAVNRPASVAFDLHLISPAEGTTLWKAKFDETQRSLLENVFNVSTFLESKGKWLTVEKLAMLGLQKMLAEMPAGKDSKTQREQIEGEGP